MAGSQRSSASTRAMRCGYSRRPITARARWSRASTATAGRTVRPRFIFAVVAMPVSYGLMLGAAGLAGRMVARSENARPIAVVDHAHVVDFTVARQEAETARSIAGSAPPESPLKLADYGDLDSALA